jgi:hypothetical protein
MLWKSQPSFARATGGTLVTFDRALAAQGALCLLPGKGE